MGRPRICCPYTGYTTNPNPQSLSSFVIDGLCFGMISSMRSRCEMRCCMSTRPHRRALILRLCDAVDYASFLENLTLRHLTATLDLSRRLDADERSRVSDGIFQSILVHARSLLSVPQGLSAPVGGTGVTSINLADCRSLSDASIKAIAAYCPSLTSLIINPFSMSRWVYRSRPSPRTAHCLRSSTSLAATASRSKRSRIEKNESEGGPLM